METKQILRDVLSLSLCEKIRLLPLEEQNKIIAQINALLEIHQPDALSAPAPRQTID